MAALLEAVHGVSHIVKADGAMQSLASAARDVVSLVLSFGGRVPLALLEIASSLTSDSFNRVLMQLLDSCEAFECRGELLSKSYLTSLADRVCSLAPSAATGEAVSDLTGLPQDFVVSHVLPLLKKRAETAGGSDSISLLQAAVQTGKWNASEEPSKGAIPSDIGQHAPSFPSLVASVLLRGTETAATAVQVPHLFAVEAEAGMRQQLQKRGLWNLPTADASVLSSPLTGARTRSALALASLKAAAIGQDKEPLAALLELLEARGRGEIAVLSCSCPPLARCSCCTLLLPPALQRLLSAELKQLNELQGALAFVPRQPSGWIGEEAATATDEVPLSEAVSL